MVAQKVESREFAWAALMAERKAEQTVAMLAAWTVEPLAARMDVKKAVQMVALKAGQMAGESAGLKAGQWAARSVHSKADCSAALLAEH